MPALLVLDTSTERLHLGLSLAGRYWVAVEDGGARASSTLLPAASALMRQAGADWRDLDVIAFGRGPGAFTGLRTACAAAQGLALGLSRRALPVDTLMAVAESARLRGGGHDQWVAMDARMGEVYAAHYRHTAGRWHTVVAPGLWAPTDLVAQWRARPPACVAGSAVAAFGATLVTDAQAAMADAAPDGAALLATALQAWQDGAACDAAHALPLYLRDRVALTTAERASLRAGGTGG